MESVTDIFSLTSASGMSQSNEILLTLAAYLKEELQKELVLQKHEATGQLLASVDVILIEEAQRTIIRGQSEHYGQYVERGRPAGLRRVPIDALEKWARTIGFSLRQGQTYRSLAFAIQQTIYRQGIPTSGAKGLAPRRTKWITEVLTAKEQHIIDRIREWAWQKMTILLDNYVKQAGVIEIHIMV